MRFLLALLLAPIGLLFPQSQPPAADRIVGTWTAPNGESKIEIAKCGGAYCGSIKAMKTPKLDARNPDASLRSRSLVGAQILRGFQYAGADTWNGGTLYAPERGREVSPKLVLTGPDTLEIKVSAGLARKTVVWKRGN